MKTTLFTTFLLLFIATILLFPSADNYGQSMDDFYKQMYLCDGLFVGSMICLLAFFVLFIKSSKH